MVYIERKTFLIFLLLLTIQSWRFLSAKETNKIDNNGKSAKNTFENFIDSLNNIDRYDKEHCGDSYCKTREIAARFSAGTDIEKIKAIAESHGFTYMGKIGGLEDSYFFEKRSGSRMKRETFDNFITESGAIWAEPQVPKVRVKRDLDAENQLIGPIKLPWPDPLYAKQWYLRNGAVGSFDMKVREAWQLGLSGKGIVVSILDDGVQGSHPDLAANYDPQASTDINSGDEDPTPRDNNDNKHGTRCAGEVASVAGNAWCGVGIAYNAKIGGVRMLDGPVSDRVEGAALSFHQSHIDIYSASWGPDDDGQTFDGPGALAKSAFFQGITKGRKGRGNIFIWASGNGGSYQDSCSCDGYTTSIYTLSVSSATFDNKQPWYLEECPSTLCTTYSSANRGQPAIISTDMPNSCTEQHTGTSASAPIAAGIVALALEANGNLTWRDMQHMVVRTSNPAPLLDNPGWLKNGVGRWVSNKFGYGLMNAEALVKLAKVWKTVPPHRVCTFSLKNFEPETLRGNFVKNYTMEVSGRCLHTSVLYIEHVQSLVSIQFKRRGDLKIMLTSPKGTSSVLLPARPRDDFRNGFQKWPFMSVQQWGENPQGLWTLTIANVGSELNTGTFHDWSLTMYGTDTKPQAGLDPSLFTTSDDASSQSLQALEPALPGHGAASSSANRQQEVDRRREVDPRWTGVSSSSAENNFGFGGGATREMKVLQTGCHPECSPEGCYSINSALDCVSCKNFKQFLRNRGGVRCVSKCDTGYYQDDESKRCNQCISGCATCSTSQFCDTCPQGTFLVDIDPEHFHHGKCASRCPEGFVNDTTESVVNFKCVAICGRNCLSCQDDQKCKFCKDGFFMSPARQCLANCPLGFFPNKENRKCQECIGHCMRCSDEKTCNECVSGYIWNSTRQSCVFEQAQVCQNNADCPSDQYCESSDNRCQICHIDCLECIGPSFDQCTTCRNGQPMDGRTKQCLPCHKGQYYEASTGKCLSCDKSCAVCTGPGKTQCHTCQKDYKQYGSLCEPCCKEKDAHAHGIYCVTCPIEVQSGQESVKNSSMLKIIIGLILTGIISSSFLMLFLTCRDRNYAKGARRYAYSKIPVANYDLPNCDENEKLIDQNSPKMTEITKTDILVATDSKTTPATYSDSSYNSDDVDDVISQAALININNTNTTNNNVEAGIVNEGLIDEKV